MRALRAFVRVLVGLLVFGPAAAVFDISTHTYTHTDSLTDSLTPSLTLTLTLTLTLSLFTLSLSHSHTVPHSHTVTLSHSLSLSALGRNAKTLMRASRSADLIFPPSPSGTIATVVDCSRGLQPATTRTSLNPKP